MGCNSTILRIDPSNGQDPAMMLATTTIKGYHSDDPISLPEDQGTGGRDKRAILEVSNTCRFVKRTTHVVSLMLGYPRTP